MRTPDPTSKPSRALAILEKHPRGLRAAELAEALGVEPKQITSILSGAVDRGDVLACDVTTGEGRKTREYRLAVAAGHAAPPNSQAFSLHRRPAGNPIVPRPPAEFHEARLARGQHPAAPAEQHAQPAVAQNTGSPGPQPSGRLPAVARAVALGPAAPSAPRAGTETPGPDEIGLQLDNDGGLVIATEEDVLALNPAQVLALGDFLAQTEGVWRP